jgi:NAD(P)-dependent dehydrogenase (short-subunit alcohol dehydrogenase family)
MHECYKNLSKLKVKVTNMNTSNLNDNYLRVAERFSLTGRRALVTGGSLSIGRAIVLAFADAGADVAVQYDASADNALSNKDAADTLLTELKARGTKHCLIQSDFMEPGSGTYTVKEAEHQLGGVDILVLCASVQKREPFVEISSYELTRQRRINFDASVELLMAVVPGMKSGGWGRILTIGSINQTKPEPDLAIYASLKSAQHNLSINLARDLAPFGVTVNNLAPGLIATARNSWRRVDVQKWKEIQEDCCPMKRAGIPEEMAGAALMLCSKAGSYITGADLQATGGAHL